eukprot:g9381.t1
MNPDVQGTHLDLDPAKAAVQGKEFFRQFSLVIACQLTETLAIQLSKVCEDRAEPSTVCVRRSRTQSSETFALTTPFPSSEGSLTLLTSQALMMFSMRTCRMW